MIPDTIASVRSELIDHPLYSELDSADRLRIFMRHHVFAVWDFFTLLKRLQSEVTTVTLPRRPAGRARPGRENLLPDVFTAVRKNVSNALAEAPIFQHYLDRHITLDHDEHGPLALKLLAALCAGDPAREAEAERTGAGAIQARIALWDG